MLDVQVTPNPFPIPMFRVDTQASLKERRIGDDDRRYMIRVLATVLCTYVQRPSMRDCEIVAKSLVAKYSFLKEHVSYWLQEYVIPRYFYSWGVYVYLMWL